MFGLSWLTAPRARDMERVEFDLDGKLIDTDYAEGETEGEYEGIIAPTRWG